MRRTERSSACTPNLNRADSIMNADPIVAEVRQIREERASRFRYDIHKIFADLIARRGAEDRSHPSVEDASKWAEAVPAEDALSVKEEPPREA